MTPKELHPEIRLSQMWDDLIAGTTLPDDADTDAMAITSLHRQMDSPGPTPAMADAIWNSIMTTTVGTLAAAATVPPRPDKAAAIRSWLVRMLPTMAWVILAGLMGGFVAGISARLMMRLSGMLTIAANRFLHTQAEATVGQITLSGTLFLGVLGAAAGVPALCFYLAIRSRLPFAGRRRSLVFGVILLAVFGYVLMDPTNSDYHRFGPAWLNVVTFSSLYLIMGYACAQIYEARPPAFALLADPNRGRSRLFAKSLMLAVVTIAGAYIAIFGILLGWQSLLIPVLALLGWAVARTGIHRNVSTLFMPVVVRQWGVWVVPGIVGFTLTARGVTEILLHR